LQGVLTGGGAQLKHIKVSRIHYGMDTRIGYPNEHLAGDSDEEFSIICYSSRVVMNGIENQKQSAIKIDEIAQPKAAVYRPVAETRIEEEEEEEVETTSKANNEESTGDKIKKHFLIAMLTRLKIF
jgi:cell division protein FtsA